MDQKQQQYQAVGGYPQQQYYQQGAAQQYQQQPGAPQQYQQAPAYQAPPGYVPEPVQQPNAPPMVPAQPQLMALIKDRPAFSHVEVYLQNQQRVLADGKAMMWMDGHVQIDTNVNEFGDAFWRCCAGESCCQNHYTGPGKVTFSHELPGDILPFAVSPGEGWILNSGAFICGSANLKVSGRFSSCMACICAQEGVFLTQVTASDQNQGVFYAGGYGALERHEVPQGKSLFIDGGLFFAASDKTVFDICLPGSVVSCLCGKEGFCMKFHGPCVVYTQNRHPGIWKRVLQPRPAPKKASRLNNGGF